MAADVRQTVSVTDVQQDITCRGENARAVPKVVGIVHQTKRV
jgi:hypothetical protein